jgi:hypothetical protein
MLLEDVVASLVDVVVVANVVVLVAAEEIAQASLETNSHCVRSTEKQTTLSSSVIRDMIPHIWEKRRLPML